MTKTIGVLLFPDAEELDFVGPYEVFGMLSKHFDQDWQVVTVAEEHEAAHQAECGKDIGPPRLPDLPAPPEILDPSQGEEQQDRKPVLNHLRDTHALEESNRAEGPSLRVVPDEQEGRQ